MNNELRDTNPTSSWNMKSKESRRKFKKKKLKLTLRGNRNGTALETNSPNQLHIISNNYLPK